MQFTKRIYRVAVWKEEKKSNYLQTNSLKFAKDFSKADRERRDIKLLMEQCIRPITMYMSEHWTFCSVDNEGTPCYFCIVFLIDIVFISFYMKRPLERVFLLLTDSKYIVYIADWQLIFSLIKVYMVLLLFCSALYSVTTCEHLTTIPEFYFLLCVLVHLVFVNSWS